MEKVTAALADRERQVLNIIAAVHGHWSEVGFKTNSTKSWYDLTGFFHSQMMMLCLEVKS